MVAYPRSPGVVPVRRTRSPLALIAVLALLSLASRNLAVSADPPHPKSLLGRWDLTVQGTDGEFPSWLEVQLSGTRTLVGFYVGQFGSARPIGKITMDQGRFRFEVPPQWESRSDDQVFEGRIEGETLQGETTDERGRRITWTAVRAPALAAPASPRWGQPIELFNGKDLSGWKARSAKAKNAWVVRDGVLVNTMAGTDLLTDRKFEDFQLRVEFRYPEKSNSGIYLRGRYELQIEDNFGAEPDSHRIGGVYGFLTPSINAAKPAGDWQTFEITLLGRVLTVIHNGERIIDRQSIPGITGGALDSREGEPGPILLQGDHGVVEFRQVTLTERLGD